MAFFFHGDRLEKSSVCGQNVVTARPDGLAVSMLPPCLQVSKRVAWAEVQEHVFQAIRHDGGGHLGSPGFGKVREVDVEVAQD